MEILVTIVIVLGVIVAGGFLLYFVGDLILSMSNKNKDDEAIKNAQDKQVEALRARVDALENSDEAKKDPEIATILYNGAVVEAYNPDEDEQAEETEETPEEAEEVEEYEEAEEDDEDIEALLAAKKQALNERLARLQSQSEEEEDEEEEEDDEVDLSDEEEESDEAEEVEEPEETEEEEQAETEQDTQEETEEETEAAAEEAEDAQEEAEVKEETNVTVLNREELEQKLAEAQERLKANEKELRSCKKEYIPLRRVKKTLEKDEDKLRRKEALVAKQKVVLYGVNNYADIDEEKAKKLAEDLDLLDGLKLSVQHCKEVMAKNEERYPLLEKIYNLLTSQNAEIKAEIKALQDALNPNDEQ